MLRKKSTPRTREMDNVRAADRIPWDGCKVSDALFLESPSDRQIGRSSDSFLRPAFPTLVIVSGVLGSCLRNLQQRDCSGISPDSLLGPEVRTPICRMWMVSYETQCKGTDIY